MSYDHISTLFLQKLGKEPPRPHRPFQRHLRKGGLTHLLFLLFLFSLTSCDNGVSAQRRDGKTYPLLAVIPKTDFNCRGHRAGYYADPETGCQVYHMCDTLEKQYSYLCPNHTLFNQKFMVCDHWYMVDCSSATTFYDLNDHIGEVPNSSGGDANQANAIRETNSVKEVKSTPVAIIFKAPGSTSSEPKIPINSLVTFKPTSGITTKRQQFVSSTTVKPSTIPALPSLSLNSTRSVQQSSKPSLNITTPPSRLLQLPNVENNLKSKFNSLLKPASPPSVFFELPRHDFGAASELSDGKPQSGLLGSSDLSNRNLEVVTNVSKFSEDFLSDLDIPFVQTPRPGTPFTMVPGIVAREPGNKFTFTSSQQKKPVSFPTLEFQEILFRPLIIRPKEKVRKLFTSAPASITSKPHHVVSTLSDQDTQHSTSTLFAAPLVNNKSPGTGTGTVSTFSDTVGVRIPSILLRPPPVTPPVSINIPPFVPRLRQSLFPPGVGKQEFMTPLTTPVRVGTTRNHQPSGNVHFQFPVSRTNREFFIPTSGLSLPMNEFPTLTKNSLDEHRTFHVHSAEHNKINMTMVFPVNLDAKLTALQLNPKCPKCHPAFLRPGECTPCVLIR